MAGPRAWSGRQSVPEQAGTVGRSQFSTLGSRPLPEQLRFHFGMARIRLQMTATFVEVVGSEANQHLKMGTPILVHVNVVGFDNSMIYESLGGMYEIELPQPWGFMLHL